MQVYSDQVGNSNLDDAKLVADTHDKERGLRTFNADYIAAMGPETALSLIASAREAARLREYLENRRIELNWELTTELISGNTYKQDMAKHAIAEIRAMQAALQHPGEQQ
jgi:hypothetical protein